MSYEGPHPLPVKSGGSGSASLTGILTGNGTTPFTASAVSQYTVLVGGASNSVSSVGPGSSGQVLQSAGAASNPAYSTATFPSTATSTGTILRADGTNWVATTATYPTTTTVSQILYSSSNNVIAGLATANRGVLTTGATGIPVVTALATDGQVIIGSTAGAPAAATLTAGAGITISNGSNSITFSTNGAIGWTDVTGASQTIAVNTNYLSDRAGAVAFTLPASATIGDMFRIAGVQGSWTLAQNANQQIKFGSSATTVGVTGSLASTNAGDCIECVSTNTSASTVWRVISSVGNITVA